jgi:hypothetical protein
MFCLSAYIDVVSFGANTGLAHGGSQLIDRRHLYASVAIEAEFYDSRSNTAITGKQGTAFVMNNPAGDFIVTNRHVLEYNYKLQPTKQNPYATLGKVKIDGHFQPADPEARTRWYSLEYPEPKITFPQDDALDIGVVAMRDLSMKNWQEIPSNTLQANHYGFEWCATTEELNSVLPGDDVFIAGYPGLSGLAPGIVRLDRPLLVSGIVSSDPRYPANFVDFSKPGYVFCHSFSWGGMSGAPVIGISHSIGSVKLLGVN